MHVAVVALRFRLARTLDLHRKRDRFENAVHGGHRARSGAHGAAVHGTAAKAPMLGQPADGTSLKPALRGAFPTAEADQTSAPSTRDIDFPRALPFSSPLGPAHAAQHTTHVAQPARATPLSSSPSLERAAAQGAEQAATGSDMQSATQPVPQVTRAGADASLAGAKLKVDEAAATGRRLARDLDVGLPLPNWGWLLLGAAATALCFACIWGVRVARRRWDTRADTYTPSARLDSKGMVDDSVGRQGKTAAKGPLRQGPLSSEHSQGSIVRATSSGVPATRTGVLPQLTSQASQGGDSIVMAVVELSPSQEGDGGEVSSLVFEGSRPDPRRHALGGRIFLDSVMEEAHSSSTSATSQGTPGQGKASERDSKGGPPRMPAAQRSSVRSEYLAPARAVNMALGLTPSGSTAEVASHRPRAGSHPYPHSIRASSTATTMVPVTLHMEGGDGGPPPRGLPQSSHPLRRGRSGHGLEAQRVVPVGPNVQEDWATSAALGGAALSPAPPVTTELSRHLSDDAMSATYGGFLLQAKPDDQHEVVQDYHTPSARLRAAEAVRMVSAPTTSLPSRGRSGGAHALWRGHTGVLTSQESEVQHAPAQSMPGAVSSGVYEG